MYHNTIFFYICIIYTIIFNLYIYIYANNIRLLYGVVKNQGMCERDSARTRSVTRAEKRYKNLCRSLQSTFLWLLVWNHLFILPSAAWRSLFGKFFKIAHWSASWSVVPSMPSLILPDPAQLRIRASVFDMIFGSNFPTADFSVSARENEAK